MVDISIYTALLSFYLMYVFRVDLKLLVIFWLCVVHSAYAFGLVPFPPFLIILIVTASYVVLQVTIYELNLFLLLQLIYSFYGDFLSPPVPIILLSKVVIVLWFVWMVGIGSFLQHKQYIFLILLVVFGDNHFLKPSYMSLINPLSYDL